MISGAAKTTSSPGQWENIEKMLFQEMWIQMKINNVETKIMFKLRRGGVFGAKFIRLHLSLINLCKNFEITGN